MKNDTRSTGHRMGDSFISSTKGIYIYIYIYDNIFTHSIVKSVSVSSQYYFGDGKAI